MKIVIWIVFYLCVSVAASSGFVFPLGDANTWFASLSRPAIAPPNWVFGPVWTMLYILMSIAAWLAWNKTSDKKILKLNL